jgi:hypothetical protein
VRFALLLAIVACGAMPPSHRYAVPAEVGTLVVDEDAFGRFAARLRGEIEVDLRGELAVAQRKDRLFTLALLDGIAGAWPAAVAHLDRIAELETDPQKRAIVGFTIRVWGAAGGDATAFRAALERELAKLPPAVHGELAMLRAMGRAFTPEVCRDLVNESVKATDGTVSIDDAQTIAFQRYAVVRLVPVGAVIDAVLAERGIGLPQAAADVRSDAISASGGRPQPDWY